MHLFCCGVGGSIIWRKDLQGHFRDPLSAMHVDMCDRRRLILWNRKGSFLSVRLDDLSSNRVTFSRRFQTDVNASNTRMNCMFLGVDDLLLVVLPREILVFDLHLGAPLASTSVPSSLPDLVHPLDSLGWSQADVSLYERGIDILFCSHIDGSISLWRRRHKSLSYVLLRTFGMGLEHVCAHIRRLDTSGIGPSLAGTVKVLGITGGILTRQQMSHAIFANGSCEFSAFSLCSDGTLWHWKIPFGADHHENDHPVDDSRRLDNTIDQVDRNTDSGCVTSVHHGLSSRTTAMAVFSKLISVPTDDEKITSALVNRCNTQLATAWRSMPSDTESALPLQRKNEKVIPIAAVGSSDGSIELIEFRQGRLTPWHLSVSTKIDVHSLPVNGIGWLGLSSRIVSFSTRSVSGGSSGNKQNLFVNRICITDVRSGETSIVREKVSETWPLTSVHPSPSGSYVLLVFKGAPAELWAFSESDRPFLLRQIDLQFTAIDWIKPLPSDSNGVQDDDDEPIEWTRTGGEKTTVGRSLSHPDGGNTTDEEPKPHHAETISDPVGILERADEERFVFALVDGRVGVLGVRGRRIRDARPSMPSWSAISNGGGLY